MSWMANVGGNPIELVEPVAEQVDFREMATALSQINRYNGQSRAVISVAHHLIIGCDIAPDPLKPWWLLHDAHEERVGDTISPVKEAWHQLTYQMFGPEAADMITTVRKELERRHDAVIHEAAGLPLPGAAQTIAIKRIDLIALATEQRDFHSRQSRPWWINDRGIAPHPKVYLPLPASKAAAQLHALFQRHLPALAKGRAA